MVIRWTDDNHEEPPPPPTIRAAQYVRMSTEHQQYSTDNQAARIAIYAEKHGLEIVKTYADEGKSGLNIKGRPALQALLDDIESGRADFTALLVYPIHASAKWRVAEEPSPPSNPGKEAGEYAAASGRRGFG